MHYSRGMRMANLVSRYIPSERLVARFASRPTAPTGAPRPMETNQD